MEDHDVSTKIDILSESDVIIILYGAGMMNVCFSKNIKNLIVITHPRFRYDWKFYDILLYQNNPGIKIIPFENTWLGEYVETGIPDIDVNSPYMMDIPLFFGTFSSLFNTLKN